MIFVILKNRYIRSFGLGFGSFGGQIRILREKLSRFKSYFHEIWFLEPPLGPPWGPPQGVWGGRSPPGRIIYDIDVFVFCSKLKIITKHPLNNP